MKLAFIGFALYPRVQEEISAIVEDAGHEITRDAREADMVCIPHHMEEHFPSEKPWIAIWVLGSHAKMLELNALENPPREIVYAVQWAAITQHPEYITNQLK